MMPNCRCEGQVGLAWYIRETETKLVLGGLGVTGEVRQVPSPAGLWRSDKDFILGRCHQGAQGSRCLHSLVCGCSSETG